MRLYSPLGFFCFFGVGVLLAPYIVFIGVDVPIYTSLLGIVVSISVLLVTLLGLLLGLSNSARYDSNIEALKGKLSNIYLTRKSLNQFAIIFIVSLALLFTIAEFHRYGFSMELDSIVQSSSQYRGIQYEGGYTDTIYTRLIPLFSVWSVVLSSIFLFSVDRLTFREKVILWTPWLFVFFHGLLLSSRMLIVICAGVILSVFVVLRKIKLANARVFFRLSILLILFVVLITLPMSMRAGRFIIFEFNEVLYDFFGYMNGFFLWMESCNVMYLCPRDVFHFEGSHTNLTTAYGDIFRNFGFYSGLLMIFLISFFSSFFARYVKNFFGFFILIFYFNFLLFSHGRVLYEYDSVFLGMVFAYFYLLILTIKFKKV